MLKTSSWAGGQHLMSRPLSNDLRERVVAAVVGGESCRTVAARVSVAVSSVVKWSQRYRATGSVAPGKMGGAPQAGAGDHIAPSVKERISQSAASDARQAEGRTGCARGQGFAQRGLDVPRREGLRFKKNASPLSRPARRLRAAAAAGGHDGRRSILGAWSSSTRPGSRPTWPRCEDGGRRANGCRALRRTRRTLTFLCALRCDSPPPLASSTVRRRMLPSLCRTAARSSSQAR